MIQETALRGGCLCGQVRFEARGKPFSASTCHCRSCQRGAGADSVAWASFPTDTVIWSGTQASKYASSAGVTRTFCGKCGSSLAYQNEAESIDLTLACFDDPEAFPPEKEIWLDHRIAWNLRNRDIPGYREFRATGLIAD